MEITIGCRVKICLWYKTLTKIAIVLTKLRLMDIETAARVLCGLSGKGCKYKIGKRKWQRLNKNIDYEVIKV